ncbi:MAG TPA: DNA polymerase IV [bacterium]|nr:DNA polymerase IV [bacterium]
MRRILHVDMDAFYASVEQRDDPTLRGKPVAVGGDANRRGVVAAASYEARVFGVKSAIPMARAVRLCPQLVIVRPDFHKYSAVSEQIFALFHEVTPKVEGLSLDEAYLDVTENAWGIPLGVDVAKRIKEEIKARTGLTASAGVAPNKFLAKIASGWKKPDGLTVIPPEKIDSFLEGLPIDALWGVGPVTAKKLRALGLEKVVDVRAADREKLHQAVGSFADFLIDLSHGIDDRDVESERERKSVGNENTFEHDLTDLARIRHEVEEMGKEVAAYLEPNGLFARTVTIKVRYKDFTTITRSESRTPATRDAVEIAARAVALLAKTDAGKIPVRLLGVSLHGLVPEPWASPRKDEAPEDTRKPRQLSFEF